MHQVTLKVTLNALPPSTIFEIFLPPTALKRSLCEGHFSNKILHQPPLLEHIERHVARRNRVQHHVAPAADHLL